MYGDQEDEQLASDYNAIKDKFIAEVFSECIYCSYHKIIKKSQKKVKLHHPLILHQNYHQKYYKSIYLIG